MHFFLSRGNFRRISTFRYNLCKISERFLQNDSVCFEKMKQSEINCLNASRLLPQHRNILNNRVPFKTPHSWVHKTEKYQRKVVGQYGFQNSFNARICFKAKEDDAGYAEYEAVLEPRKIKEMMELAQVAGRKRSKVISKREEELSLKLEKLNKWKQELNDKFAKKEAESLAAKERKERMMEDVRRHFGFKVDPRDERFKEMLEQKEKEDKKKLKEAKRKAKEEKMLAKLVQKSPQEVENST